MTAVVIIVVMILILFFVRVKAKKSGGFDRYLFQTLFSGLGMLVVFIIFYFFIHIEDPIKKFAVMSISMAIGAAIFDTLAGMVYKGGR